MPSRIQTTHRFAFSGRPALPGRRYLADCRGPEAEALRHTGGLRDAWSAPTVAAPTRRLTESRSANGLLVDGIAAQIVNDPDFSRLGGGESDGGCWCAAAGDGLVPAAAGATTVAEGNEDLATGLGAAAEKTPQLAEGLGSASDGVPQIVDGTKQLSAEGTQKLIEAGNDTAMDFGMRFAIIEAAAETTKDGGLPYGAPEQSDLASAAYTMDLAGEGSTGWQRRDQGHRGARAARRRRRRWRGAQRPQVVRTTNEGGGPSHQGGAPALAHPPAECDVGGATRRARSRRRSHCAGSGGEIGHEDRGAGDDAPAQRRPLAPLAVLALRPLRLDQVHEGEPRADQLAHPLAQRPVVLGVERAAVGGVLDVRRGVEVRVPRRPARPAPGRRGSTSGSGG